MNWKNLTKSESKLIVDQAIEEEKMIPSVIDVEYKELHDMIYSAFDKALDVLNIQKEETIGFGDGANDISMFQHAGKRVAFCAKPKLKEHANIKIEDKDLTNILHHL